MFAAWIYCWLIAVFSRTLRKCNSTDWQCEQSPSRQTKEILSLRVNKKSIKRTVLFSLGIYCILGPCQLTTKCPISHCQWMQLEKESHHFPQTGLNWGLSMNYWWNDIYHLVFDWYRVKIVVKEMKKIFVYKQIFLKKNSFHPVDTITYVGKHFRVLSEAVNIIFIQIQNILHLALN